MNPNISADRLTPIALLFLAIRYMRRLRRSAFQGNTPDWASDSYKVLKFVNIFELAPTIVVLLVKPAHLFTRMAPIRQKKKKLYKTPLQFFLTCASIMAGRIVGFSHSIEPFAATAIICLIGLTFIAFVPLLARLARLFDEWWRDGAGLRFGNSELRRALCSKYIYVNADRSRLLFGLFYCGIYGAVATIIVASVGVLIFGVGRGIDLGPTSEAPVPVKLFVVLRGAAPMYFMGPIIIAAERLIFVPYLELLRHCNRATQGPFIKSDFEPIRKAMAGFAEHYARYHTLQTCGHDRSAARQLLTLRSDLQYLARRLSTLWSNIRPLVVRDRLALRKVGASRTAYINPAYGAVVASLPLTIVLEAVKIADISSTSKAQLAHICSELSSVGDGSWFHVVPAEGHDVAVSTVTNESGHGKLVSNEGDRASSAACGGRTIDESGSGIEPF